MNEVSADTNILIDFSILEAVSLLFELPYRFHIERSTYNEEIAKPHGLREFLLECGIIVDDLGLNELFLADEIREKVPQLSRCDCLMLALAKSKSMILATGDKNLRKTAEKYGVKVIGTIFLIDKLLQSKKINKKQYKEILQKALNKNDSKELRLPRKELIDRLNH